MSNAAIERMITDRVVATLAAERTAAAAKDAKVARAGAAAKTNRAVTTVGGAEGSNNAGPAAGAGGPNVAGPTLGVVAMNAVPEFKDCSYIEFMSCQPTNFKGTEGVYCPHNEVQKLEVELWKHMVKGVDITTYNRQFQELVILCPAMVPTKEKLLERYVWGLPQPIQGNVTSFDLDTIGEAMRMARRLIDKVVRAGTVQVHDNNHNRNHNNNPNNNNNNKNNNNNNNKRRWNDNRSGDNNNPNNQNQNINHLNQQNCRQENVRGYATAAAPAGGRGYAGNLLYATDVNYIIQALAS
ncbi:hypothetical protein Tco_1040674 [Tanacetum coccineum]